MSHNKISASCPFCKLSVVRVFVIDSPDEPGRKSRAYAECSSCFSRGPRMDGVVRFEEDQLTIINRAIDLWNVQATQSLPHQTPPQTLEKFSSSIKQERNQNEAELRKIYHQATIGVMNTQTRTFAKLSLKIDKLLEMTKRSRIDKPVQVPQEPDEATPLGEAYIALKALGYKSKDIGRLLKNVSTNSLKRDDIIRAALRNAAASMTTP